MLDMVNFIILASFRTTKFQLAFSSEEIFHKIFFSVKDPDQCNCLHDSYKHFQDCYISISVLKHKIYFTFNQMLLLLFGDMSLNSVLTGNSDSQYFCKPFENKILHFLHLSVKKVLPNQDEILKLQFLVQPSFKLAILLSDVTDVAVRILRRNKTKSTFVGIIYRPLNNINFLECI